MLITFSKPHCPPRTVLKYAGRGPLVSAALAGVLSERSHSQRDDPRRSQRRWRRRDPDDEVLGLHVETSLAGIPGPDAGECAGHARRRVTLSLVSLMAANVDQAASDLAAHLTAVGIDTRFESGSHSHRMDRVTTGNADIVWLCGWQALEFDGTSMDLVAAPTFPLESPSTYRSFIISRTPAASLEELLAGDPLWVMNEPTSWSGHWAVRAECDLRGLTVPSRIVWSGSHVDSIRMVAEGSADVAAIDSTVWRWRNVQSIAVVDVTRSWPAPPVLIRSGIEDGTQQLAAQIVGATQLRAVESLVSADWSHLDPMRNWAAS